MIKKIILLMLVTMNCYAATWECINRKMAMCNTWRMFAPKGWLVASENTSTGDAPGYAMVFVPDEKHEWKV